MPDLPYWAALGLTLAVEAPVAAALAARGRRTRTAGMSVLLNLVTHPAAWLVAPNGLAAWAALELAVTAAEALGYRWFARLGWRRALIVSAACNAATAGLALVLFGVD